MKSLIDSREHNASLYRYSTPIYLPMADYEAYVLSEFWGGNAKPGDGVSGREDDGGVLVETQAIRL
ncbi:hypothetical protein [Allocoleopsis sp.]|uniref:hypothetical protein n=1 Tax=Allocoleopsis sp. TaxID=3088169 RepID=UPI002FCF80B0